MVLRVLTVCAASSIPVGLALADNDGPSRDDHAAKAAGVMTIEVSDDGGVVNENPLRGRHASMGGYDSDLNSYDSDYYGYGYVNGLDNEGSNLVADYYYEGSNLGADDYYEGSNLGADDQDTSMLKIGKSPEAVTEEVSRLNELRLSEPGAKLAVHMDILLLANDGPSECVLDGNKRSQTPSAIEGPYFLPPEDQPFGFPDRKNVCRVNSEKQEQFGYTDGIPVSLTGRVISTKDCKPIPGAEVNFWQADPNGVYWHLEEDFRTVKTDANGQLKVTPAETGTDRDHDWYNCRAVETADEGGKFAFETVMPGRYKAGNAYRPRHLHLRVKAENHTVLITQYYFHGDWALGDNDVVCSEICSSKKYELVLKMTKDLPNGTKSEFNLKDDLWDATNGH